MNKWKIILVALCFTSSLVSFGQAIFNDSEYPNSQYLKKDQDQYIDWRIDHVGFFIDQENNEIYKTASDNAWDASLASENIMKAGATSGYVDVALDVDIDWGSRIIGLSYSDKLGVSSTSISYGFYLGGNHVYVRERGDFKMYLGFCEDGDVFRVENVAGYIQYYKNSVLVYVSTAPLLDQDMHVHAIMYRKRSLDFIATSLRLPLEENFNIRNGYDVSGLLNWKDTENLKTDEYASIIKSTITSDYDAGARSTNFLPTNVGGSITIDTQFISGEQTIGLNNRGTSFLPSVLSTIEYGMTFKENGFYELIIGTTTVTDLSYSYAVGDQFTISKSGTDLTFEKNAEGPEVYPISASDEYEVVFSLKETTSKLHTIKVSENFDQVIRRNWLFETRGADGPINYEWELNGNNEVNLKATSLSETSSSISYMAPEVWKNLSNFDAGNAQAGRVDDLVMSVGATTASAWGETITKATDDVSMSFKLTEDAESRIIGFSTQSNSTSNSYAVRLFSGSVYCLENGLLVAVVPTVELNTEIRISRYDGNIYYDVGNTNVSTGTAPTGALYPFALMHNYVEDVEDVYVSVQPSLSVSELAADGPGNLMCYVHALPLINTCGSEIVAIELGIAQAQYPVALKIINTETGKASDPIILTGGDLSVAEMGYWGTVNFEGVPPGENYVLQLIENFDSDSDGTDDTIAISYADVFVESAALWNISASSSMTTTTDFDLQTLAGTNVGESSYNYLSTNGEGSIFIRPIDFSDNMVYLFVGFEDETTTLTSDYTEQFYGIRMLRISPNRFQYHIINDGSILDRGVLNIHDVIRISKEGSGFTCYRDDKPIHNFSSVSNTELKINVIFPKASLSYIGSSFCSPQTMNIAVTPTYISGDPCEASVFGKIEATISNYSFPYSNIQINSGQIATVIGPNVFEFNDIIFPGTYKVLVDNVYGVTESFDVLYDPPTYDLETIKNCFTKDILDFNCNKSFPGEISILPPESWSTITNNYATDWYYDEDLQSSTATQLTPACYSMDYYGGPAKDGPFIEFDLLRNYATVNYNLTIEQDETVMLYGGSNNPLAIYTETPDVFVQSKNYLDQNRDGLVNIVRNPHSANLITENFGVYLKAGTNRYGFYFVDDYTIEVRLNETILATVDLTSSDFQDQDEVRRYEISREYDIHGKYFFRIYRYPGTSTSNLAESVDLIKSNAFGELEYSYFNGGVEGIGGIMDGAYVVVESDIILPDFCQVSHNNHSIKKIIIQASFCEPSKDVYYAFMKRKPDGGRHEVVSCGDIPFSGDNAGCDFPEFSNGDCVGNNVSGKNLLFRYDESYYTGDAGTALKYKIYNYAHELEMNVPSDLIVMKGDNRYVMDVSGINVDANPYYLLEVTNEKNEKRYLRFKMPAY